MRELKLNRRKRGLRGRINNPTVLENPNGVVKKNLRTVPYASNKTTRHNSKLRLLLMNTQSIRNKDTILSEYMGSEAIDIAIATETWLTSSVRDVVWLESNNLVKDGYQISVRNREGKRGGGLALIYRSNIIAKGLPARKQRPFEVTHWMTTIGNSTLNILGIYYPPYSVGQNITNVMFLDESDRVPYRLDGILQECINLCCL